MEIIFLTAALIFVGFKLFGRGIQIKSRCGVRIRKSESALAIFLMISGVSLIFVCSWYLVSHLSS